MRAEKVLPEEERRHIDREFERYQERKEERLKEEERIAKMTPEEKAEHEEELR